MFVNNTQLSPKAQQRQGTLLISVERLSIKKINARTPMKEFHLLEEYLKQLQTKNVPQNTPISVLDTVNKG